MIQHWVLTTPTGPNPDKPHVLLRTTDGIDPELWAPTENAWIPAPFYFGLIYGDDPDAVPVTDETAEQYKADGVGLDADALTKFRNMQDGWGKPVPEETPEEEPANTDA